MTNESVVNHKKTYKQALRENNAVYFVNQKAIKKRCVAYREELTQWKRNVRMLKISQVEENGPVRTVQVCFLRSKEEEKFFEQIQELQIKLNNVDRLEASRKKRGFVLNNF